MKALKKFLIIIIMLVLPVALQAKSGRVYVKAAIDSIEIFIGQQAKLTVDVTADCGAKVVYPTYERAQFITPGVEVLGSTDADTALIDNGMMTVSKTFTITSFEEKLYAIPGMKVSVDGKAYTANQLALKVIPVEVDTLHLDKFFPPKDVQDNPFDWSEWSGVFWMSAIVLLLCMLCCYLAVCLKQNKPVIVRIRVIKKVLPHQKALTVIEKLRKEKLNSSENQKEYYTQLTDALRQYIKERFGFNAMEMTSSEILDRLHETGDQKMLDELKELFYTADLVKFAKYSTLLNENDMNLVNAINFIDQTKIENQPTEEKIVPKLTENDIKTRQNRIVIKTLIAVASVVILVMLCFVIYKVYLLMV